MSQEKILQILSEDMYPFQRPQKIPDGSIPTNMSSHDKTRFWDQESAKKQPKNCRDKINILKMFKEIKEIIISMKKVWETI